MKMRVRLSERERYREPETMNTSSVHQCEDTRSERARARERQSERARERESERAREQEPERKRAREKETEGKKKNLSSVLCGHVGKRGREETHRSSFVDTLPQRMRE